MNPRTAAFVRDCKKQPLLESEQLLLNYNVNKHGDNFKVFIDIMFIDYNLGKFNDFILDVIKKHFVKI